jgi:hypothetical protein
VSWDLFQFISIAILWVLIIRNLQIMRRWKRQHQDLKPAQLVEITGLTPLQVQVAMDAAMAIFDQRIEEMRAHRDHH